MGTAVGTQVFIEYGWRPAAALSIAWSGFTLAVMLARGPHCARHTWFGYEGGFELRQSRVRLDQRGRGCGENEREGGVGVGDAPEVKIAGRVSPLIGSGELTIATGGRRWGRRPGMSRHGV